MVGNPNSGKTTLAFHMSLFNATQNPNLRNRETHLFMAESDILEAQLAFLTMTRRITAREANDLRYKNDARTPANIDRVRGLWDETLSTMPLYVYSLEGRNMEDVISLASGVHQGLVIIDHIYAFVWQSEDMRRNLAVEYAKGFSAARRVATDNNNVVVVFNQYTKAEQTDEAVWRNPESGFGGAAQLNMSGFKLNLKTDPALNTPTQVCVQSLCVKSKVSLVEATRPDGSFYTVDPNWKEMVHFIDKAYRRITDYPAILE